MGWAFAFFLLSGCTDSRSTNPPIKSENKAVDPRFAEIDGLVRQSCLCELAGRDHTKIDAALKAATTGLKVEGSAEPSAPLAGLYDCYPELGERACTSSCYLTASPEEARVCDLGQVKQLEKAWRSVEPGSDGSVEAPNKAVLERLSTMRKELAETIPQSACN
jgi:hypothetical protein